MSILKAIRKKIQEHHEGTCGCHHHDAAGKAASPSRITKDMIVREVADWFPQTVGVFGKHRVDFCCGGAHSIDQTARARGCRDVDALVADLNRAIGMDPAAPAQFR